MKVTRIILKDFQQFKNFDLDLTDKSTGRPLEKVCFIGRNGTGKSTLLRLVWKKLKDVHAGLRTGFQWHIEEPAILIKFELERGSFWLCANAGKAGTLFDEDIENSADWTLLTQSVSGAASTNRREVQDRFRKYLLSKQKYNQLTATMPFTNSEHDMVIFSPPDSTSLLPLGQRLPRTTLNDALPLFKDFPSFHEANTQRVEEFWKILIYHVKKREEAWQNYLLQQENRQKSVEQAEYDFQQSHPEILAHIAKLWNRILEPAGLEFDYQAAKKPVQLNDNLEAFVKVKSSGLPLEYNALSSGIRNFIFRLGHIYSLYFGRSIERGVLLLDEPENSLFPDFLYDLVDIYEDIICNTQMFVATHNPIIAAQFRPEERVILEFDSNGFVWWRSGVTPLGDDPNDLLVKDFEVRSIYGPEGLEKWERFLALRRLIKGEADPSRKRAMIDEYMQIGNAYNFAADAVPQENP